MQEHGSEVERVAVGEMPTAELSPEGRQARARLLTDEAKGVIEAAEEFFRLVVRIHDEELWRDVGYKSWGDYLLREFDRSRSSGNRWVTRGREMFALEAEGAGQSDPRVRRTTIPGSGPMAPRVSGREAARIQAARNRGEEPAPPPSEADRIAEASAKAKARAQAKLARAHPTVLAREAPESPQEAVARLLTLDPVEAAPHLSVGQVEAVQAWATAVARARLGRRELRPVRRPAHDCPPHPVGRTIDGVCMACMKNVKGSR